ncbi:glutaredoxin family protein [Candidatus Saccharibacteria bacterium]|nr:glutaredoxin family protein [Candidatus Saccharibacteria bacterium]
MKKITIYSTTTCPYCMMLKSWLDDKGISYTDHLVDRNPIAAQQMVNLSGQMGVPFSTVENEDGSIEKILGFDRNRFELALAN